MGKHSKGDDYSEEEAQRRFEQALKGGLKTPPIPLKKKASAKRKGAKKTKR